MEQELRRADDVFPASTKNPLSERLILAWVVEHAKALVYNETQGCEVMFESDNVEELSKLYHLLSLAPNTLLEIQTVMENCVIRNGEIDIETSIIIVCWHL